MHPAFRKLVHELEQKASKNGISPQDLRRIIEGNSIPDDLPDNLRTSIKAISYMTSDPRPEGRKPPLFG